MTDRVQIEFARMEELASNIGTASAVIAEHLARLDGEISMLALGWTGEASDAYAKAHREWTTSLGEMNRVLGSIHSATGSITNRHRAAEQKVRALWGN